MHTGRLVRLTLLALVTAALGGISSVAHGRDDRNDNDRQREQRHDAREQFFFFLAYQQQLLAQQQLLTHQAAAVHYIQHYRNLARSGYLPVGGDARPIILGDPRARIETYSAPFREAPGERELDLARLYSQVDPNKARAWYNQAVQRAGEGSDVAELAKRELKSLDK